MKKAFLISLFLICVSLSGFAQTSIQGREVDVRAFGAKCDGVTNDTAAIQAAITAMTTAGGIVNLPDGTCLVTGLSTPGGVWLRGKGKYVTTIKSSTNAVILNLVQGSGTFAFFGPKVTDLAVDGSDSGSSQIGIQITDGLYMRDVVIEDVQVTDCGSHGVSFGSVFSSSFKNIYSSSHGGYPFFYNSPNMPSNYFYGLYAGDVSAAAPAGFRIKQGAFTCWSCNGVNNVPATAYWAVIGGAAGDIDGDAGPFFATAIFRDCNIEGAPTAGALVYPASRASFLGYTTFVGLAGSSGNWKAIQYDTDAAYFPENAARAYIEDTVVFSNSPASFFANSQPIHSDGLPPLSVVGRGPQIAGGGAAGLINTYYNTATSRAERLPRVDGFAPTIDITTSTSFTNPGGRAYRVNCASPCTLTLPSPNFYENGNEVITVFNLSATGTNVTIAANGGASVNGSSYVLSVQGASVQLFPDFTSLDWRVVATRQDTGTSPRIPYYADANRLTTASGLEYDSSGAAVKTPGRFWAADTSASNPSFAFTSDTDTGFYRPSANTIGIAANGANVGSFGATGLTLGVPGSVAGALILANSTNSNTTTLQSGAPASSISITLPATLPASAGCLQISSTGVITQTGSACGAGGGSVTWDAITNPAGNQALSMGAFTTAWTWNATTGANNLFQLADGASNTGTGYVLSVNTATGSAAKPVRITAGGTASGVEMTTAGVLQAIGTGENRATMANPSATIGLTATNGTSTSAMRADAAPALSQSIAPTWTALHTFNPGTTPTTAALIDINTLGSAGTRDSNWLMMRGRSNDGSTHLTEWKQFVDVNTNAGGSLWSLESRIDAASFAVRFTVSDAGAVSGGAFSGDSFTASGGSILDDDINAATGFTIAGAAPSGQYPRGNGTRAVFSAIQAGDLPGSFSGFANPSATIGLTATNGVATTAMRSDAAPALSQSIAPTWTASHTFAATMTAREIDPQTDNTYDLGTTSLRWKTVHVGPGSLVVHNDATNTLKATLGFSGSTAQLTTDSATPLQLRTGSNNGLFLNTNGTIGFNLATATNGNIDLRQIANGDQILNLRRATDTSPTGNFINFENAAGTDLFTVDITGSLTAGTIPAARISSGTIAPANGGTGQDTSGSTGMPLITSGTWSVISTTGSGNAVRATSPTLVTPVLGAATATSINGLTITSSTGTLTLTNSKTASFSNTLTFTGTDGSSVAFGAGGTVAYVGLANSWTAGIKQTFAPNGTTAGFNVGSVAGDPSTPANGDLWYDSTANELTARINGANVALGSGGGSGNVTTAGGTSGKYTKFTSGVNIENALLSESGSDISGTATFTITNPSASSRLLVGKSIASQTADMFALFSTSDTNPRVAVDSSFRFQFGPGGATSVDTNLYRSAAATLRTDGSFIAGTSGTFVVGSNGNITSIRGVTTNFPASNSAGVLTNDGSGNFSWVANSSPFTSSAGIIDFTTSTDRLRLIAGSTSTTPLEVDGVPSQTADLIQVKATSGAANPIVAVDASGRLQFGAGGGTGVDTNLYRSTANTLKTDDFFESSVHTIAGGTVTANTPPVSVTQTWNNSGVTFEGIKLNVTNTASSSSSTLIDLQIGGSSQFSVNRSGTVTTVTVNASSFMSIGGVTVPTISSTDTLTNKTMSGSSNTFSNIAATSLAALNTLTTATPATDDSIPIYDTSAAANRRATVTEVVGTVTEGYINGAVLTYSSTTQVQITTGTVHIQSSNSLMRITSTLTISPTLSTNTWYHCYVYSNSGTPTGECVTTAPASPYTGTARSKTSDTTRRYVGSIRTDGSSQIRKFVMSGGGSFRTILWMLDTTASPFRVLSGGLATTNTNVDLSSVVPNVSSLIKVARIRLVNLSSAAVYVFVDNADMSGTNPAGGSGFTGIGQNADVAISIPINSSQIIRYAYSGGTPTGSGAFIEVQGYEVEL